MARWRPWVVICAVTWQRYCANKNGSEKPVSNCWRRVDLPGRVVHRASQGGWSKRLSLMHMGVETPNLSRGARHHAWDARARLFHALTISWHPLRRRLGVVPALLKVAPIMTLQ